MATKSSAMPDSKLDRNIAFQMASIIFRLDQDLRDTILRKLDLTYVHFRVLQYLYEEDGQKIGDIATAIVVRQPVLSRVVDQMEERALVKRRADPSDNRLMRVYLTAKGKARYKEAWPPAHAMIEQALHNFDQHEHDTLSHLLSKLAHNIFN